MNYPCHEPCRDNDGCACRAASAARPVGAYMVDRDLGDEAPHRIGRWEGGRVVFDFYAPPTSPLADALRAFWGREFLRRMAVHEDNIRFCREMGWMK